VVNDPSQYTGPDPGRIHSMFRMIASRYDRANTVMSGGVHHLWRKKAVQAAGAGPGDRILDCATGTGDLAIAFRKAVGPSGRVVGTDFVPEMIAEARTKAADIQFEVADVTAWPYDDASFDVASISFGIRNVGDPRKGLGEMARVVRSGGRVVVVEFGQPSNRLFRPLYDLYRTRILPRLGGLVTGEQAAYEYLDRSAARFPHGQAFAEMMGESARFASISVKPLSLGIAWLYVGTKA
jgi:demethylmenaquinone methyltransferase/2-methoxy-6-polyprenyl-1,4-benzoquinol methylase